MADVFGIWYCFSRFLSPASSILCDHLLLGLVWNRLIGQPYTPYSKGPLILRFLNFLLDNKLFKITRLSTNEVLSKETEEEKNFWQWLYPCIVWLVHICWNCQEWSGRKNLKTWIWILLVMKRSFQRGFGHLKSEYVRLAGDLINHNWALQCKKGVYLRKLQF